ncbi:Protein MOM-2 [Aphelenchoides avenae]|nr:Protein MOM-2 [Aphelenchus avenae]
MSKLCRGSSFLQVAAVPDSDKLQVLQPTPSSVTSSPTAGRSERFLRPAVAAMAKPGELVFLDESPDYCVADPKNDIRGTSGRECGSERECLDLCCGHGWETVREFRREPCRCQFVWCCEVKCDTCVREVERFFCR